jgi:hypothetical protein
MGARLNGNARVKTPMTCGERPVRIRPARKGYTSPGLGLFLLATRNNNDGNNSDGNNSDGNSKNNKVNGSASNAADRRT